MVFFLFEENFFQANFLDKITCVTVTPDNKFIVTTSYDKSVKIIDLTFKKEVHHFQEAQMGNYLSRENSQY